MSGGETERKQRGLVGSCFFSPLLICQGFICVLEQFSLAFKRTASVSLCVLCLRFTQRAAVNPRSRWATPTMAAAV